MAAGRLPRHRLALLGPGERDAWYSASPGYASALVGTTLPLLCSLVRVRGPVVAMGASLGAAAAFHAEHAHPGTFGGMLLQSGSFLVPRADGPELAAGRFARLERFVGQVLAAPVGQGDRRGRPRPQVSMTCGALEGNAASNRLVAGSLRAQGYRVAYAEVPDLHTYTAWRDAWDPYLTDLLREVWDCT